jgi:hypothetical protein
MSISPTLSYELMDTGTGTRLTVLLPGGATYAQDFPLSIEQIKRVSIQYPEHTGLIITVIEQSSRGHVSFIPPTALLRYLREAVPAPMMPTRAEASHYIATRP